MDIYTIRKLYEKGFSISEVAKKLRRSPSGIKYILLKAGTTIRSRGEAVRLKHHKRLNSYSCSIPKKIPSKLTKLYISGLALYWGEGSKSGNTVAIANSDPELILSFLTFLRKICNVDERRLHILIHFHLGQDENTLIKFWSQYTGIPRNNFYTGTVHKQALKKSTKRLKFGTISLRYADSLLFKDILERIDELKIK